MKSYLALKRILHVVSNPAENPTLASPDQRALATLAEFPIERHAHGILLRRVWDLRHNISAYDAIYVALAEALGATLMTHNRRLADAAAKWVTVALV